MIPKLKSSFGSAGKTVSTETKTFLLLPTALHFTIIASYNFTTSVELREAQVNPRLGPLQGQLFKRAKAEIGQGSVVQASKR